MRMFHLMDRSKWQREKTFSHFWAADIAYTITKDLDVTELLAWCKSEKQSFFAAVCYLMLSEMEQQQAFCLDLDEKGQLGYWDQLAAEYTVMDPKTKEMDSLSLAKGRSFLQFASNMQRQKEDFFDRQIRPVQQRGVVLFSCVPWFSFTSLTMHSRDNHLFLRPMVCWGQWEMRQGRAWMPLALTIHHAAADGYHCGLFFQGLAAACLHPDAVLQ